MIEPPRAESKNPFRQSLFAEIRTAGDQIRPKSRSGLLRSFLRPSLLPADGGHVVYTKVHPSLLAPDATCRSILRTAPDFAIAEQLQRNSTYSCISSVASHANLLESRPQPIGVRDDLGLLRLLNMFHIF